MDTTSQTRKEAPFFSIVIPLYNKEKNIGSTIDSVLNQTFSDFELIVVDDGSTDRSAEIVASYDDPRIRLIKKENGGVSSARNRGVKSSVGHYLYFLDADDIMVAECLEKFDELVEMFPSYNVYASNFFMYHVGKSEEPFLPAKSECFLIVNPFRSMLNGDLFLRVGNNIINRNYAVNFRFDEKICIYEDLDYYLRIIESQCLPYTPLCLYRYCIDNVMLSVSLKRIDEHFAYYADLKAGSYEHRQINANNVVVTILAKLRAGRVWDAFILLYRHKSSFPTLFRITLERLLKKIETMAY